MAADRSTSPAILRLACRFACRSHEDDVDIPHAKSKNMNTCKQPLQQWSAGNKAVTSEYGCHSAMTWRVLVRKRTPQTCHATVNPSTTPTPKELNEKRNHVVSLGTKRPLNGRNGLRQPRALKERYTLIIHPRSSCSPKSCALSPVSPRNPVPRRYRYIPLHRPL